MRFSRKALGESAPRERSRKKPFCFAPYDPQGGLANGRMSGAPRTDDR